MIVARLLRDSLGLDLSLGQRPGESIERSPVVAAKRREGYKRSEITKNLSKQKPAITDYRPIS